ncbi:MAG: hypothetical protein ACXVHS_08155, partial [Methanobacterium sp.]
MPNTKPKKYPPAVLTILEGTGARISIDKSNPTIKPTNNLGGEELRKEFVQLSIESPKIKNGIKIKSRIAITKNAHLILL